MTDILDAEELETALRCAVDALERAPRDTGTASLHSDWLRPIIAAARAHRATLPRWKEVEVEQWVIVSPHGVVLDPLPFGKSGAERDLGGYLSGCQAVRLTGTAKVRA